MRKTFIAIAAAAVLMPASGWAAPPFTTPLEPRSESGLPLQIFGETLEDLVSLVSLGRKATAATASPQQSIWLTLSLHQKRSSSSVITLPTRTQSWTRAAA
jgi:hypothetical protein